MEVLQVDFQSPNAAEQFTTSLRQTGFGVLKNHPIQKKLLQKVYSDWEAFFNDKSKFDYLYEEKIHAGYFPMEVSELAQGSVEKDIKEYFHFYPWHTTPKNIGSETQQLFSEMSQLAATLLQWIQDFTPSEIAEQYSMPLSDMITDCPKTMLRILHYPPFQGNEPAGAVRAAAHSDVNLITLLPAATQNGLQVKDLKGNWHDVPCDFGMISVNIADMLQLASKHYYPSTIHRVINPGGGIENVSRLSLPLFLHARPEVRLSDDFTAKEFWQQRLRELGVLDEGVETY